MLDAASVPDALQLLAHHRWRTDWTTDRVCLSWYLTFETDPALGDLVHRLAPALGRLSWVHAVPSTWLHLTLREVGFADELDAAEVHRIAAEADRVLEHLPMRLEVGGVTTMTDAVVLPVRLDERLAAVHCAIDQTCGRPARPEEEPFWPHITIGYLAQDGHRDDVAAAFADVEPQPTYVTPRLTLAAVTRLPTHYCWEPVAVLGP